MLAGFFRSAFIATMASSFESITQISPAGTSRGIGHLQGIALGDTNCKSIVSTNSKQRLNVAAVFSVVGMNSGQPCLQRPGTFNQFNGFSKSGNGVVTLQIYGRKGCGTLAEYRLVRRDPGVSPRLLV